MNPNESSIKGKFFQKKTLSEKNIPGGGKERIQSYQLSNLLKIGHPQNLTNFLEKEHPPTQLLNEGVISLIKRYQNVDEKLYELLNILFSYGASPNISVIFDGEPPIKENENISLLMFAIKNKDLNLVNLILKFNPEINKKDIYGRTPIIYAVIFNNNDSTDILNLLIQHKANINYSLQLKMSEDQYQYHSVFTLAIFQDLKNVTKCLIDNNVDVNFRTAPRGDTGLHIAAYYAKAELLELLLSYPKIVAYIDAKNNDGKKPYELIKDNEEKEKKNFIFKNCYFNIRMNNQNMKMNYPIMNNNMKNLNPQLNKMQQMNPMQVNSINELNNLNNYNFTNFEQINSNNNNQMIIKNINNGKLLNLNTSPNVGYNYIPQGINMNIGNHSTKNNNLNLLNNCGMMMNNNNINNSDMMKNMINNNISNESNDNSIEIDDTNANVNINANTNINNQKSYSNKKNNNNDDEEKNINKEQNKNIMINQEISQNTQMQNQILRENNKDINIYNINPYKLNKIKNNLYNKLINKNEIRSNFEIPVEFINKKQKQNMYNMNNFIQKKNIPTLNIDLSSKALSLELKLNELREKEKKINNRYKEVVEEVKEISKEKKKQKEKLNNKEKERNFISSQIEDNKLKINGLYKEQKDLVDEFPPNKLSDKFYKNIPDVQFKKIKFEPPFLDEYYKINTLNKDLIDYEKYINYLNAKKKPKIDLILQKIKLSVDEALPGYDIKFYGAYGAGINLPWSDINIILFNNNNNKEKNINNNKDGDNITDIETTTGEKSVLSTSEMTNNLTSQESSVCDKNNNFDIGILNNIFNCLKKYNLVINNELNIIRNESTCYLSLTTKEEFGNIKIYISIDKPNHPGLKRLELIKSFLKEYPPLRPTILVLEKILKEANLNNQNKGGLPFYGLILMVVSFIQNQKDKYNYSFKEENINGTIFYEFLKYYGLQFDFNKFVIMTYKVNEINNPLNDKENQFTLGPNPNIKELIILDPIDKKTNVGKPTFQYMNIKMAFLIAFMVIQEDCECGCHYGRAYFEHNYISTEHCFLKRIFNSVKRFIDN